MIFTLDVLLVDFMVDYSPMCFFSLFYRVSSLFGCLNSAALLFDFSVDTRAATLNGLNDIRYSSCIFPLVDNIVLQCNRLV